MNASVAIKGAPTLGNGMPFRGQMSRRGERTSWRQKEVFLKDSHRIGIIALPCYPACWFLSPDCKNHSCTRHLQANGTDTSPSLWGQQGEADSGCSDTLFKWHVDRHPLNPVNPSSRFFMPSCSIGAPPPPGLEHSPFSLPALLLFTVNCLQICTLPVLDCCVLHRELD